MADEVYASIFLTMGLGRFDIELARCIFRRTVGWTKLHARTSETLIPSLTHTFALNVTRVRYGSEFVFQITLDAP